MTVCAAIPRNKPTNGRVHSPSLPSSYPTAVKRRASNCLIWCCISLSLLSSCLATLMYAISPDPGATVVAAAFPPWWSSAEVFSAVAESGSTIVRGTSLDSMVVVRTNFGGAMSLRRAGAVWLIDPAAVSACLKNNFERN